MIFYTLDYVIDKTIRQLPTAEQNFLKRFTDERFTRAEAGYLFSKINDHKWYVSERLQRDVGLAVAAVDYLENFYESKKDSAKRGKFYDVNVKVYENLSLTS